MKKGIVVQNGREEWGGGDVNGMESVTVRMGRDLLYIWIYGNKELGGAHTKTESIVPD